jgi:hypothetical protein
MSASRPLADIRRCRLYVRKVPKADIKCALSGRYISGGIARIEALAAVAVMMLACSLFVSAADHAAFSQRIIQGVPNRSATMPKRSAKKVSPIGMRTVPPSAKALKMRSASAAVSTPTVTEKPLG